MNKIAVVILAAGASKRLGKPKQLLPYKNGTLLSCCLDQLEQVPNLDLFVVLGAYADAIRLTIHNRTITIIDHPNWEEGMGSSLSAGVKALQQKDNYKAVIVTLSDLPFAGTEHYIRLIDACVQRGGIVVSNYGNLKGVPAIIPQRYFQELADLKGDEGAKPIVEKHKKEVSDIASETPYFDVDTDEAYQQLLKLS